MNARRVENAARPSPGDAVSVASAAAGPSTTNVPPDVLAAEAAARSPVFAQPGTPPAPVGVIQPVPAPPPPPPPTGYVPPYTPAPQQVFAPPAPGAPPAAPADPASRRRSPTLVVDLGPGASGAPAAAAAAAAGPAAQAALAAQGPRRDLNADEQFAERIGGADEPQQVRATMLREKTLTVPQGATINAVLETALNSDLPGFARAVVSRDVRGFDGKTVLIPRGSRVVGQYRSGVAVGQSRAFVIWSRLLRPDGASVQIASSATDPLGRAGLAGEVDRHFFQRFGGSALLSVINGAVGALTQRPSTQITIGSGQDASAIASSVGPANISPTIKVVQGTPIRIFVARDLDFSTVQ
ncbi:MAG: type VI secretion protein [Proteobacteria bacterium]|nr:type VI secretion protein [Pseudomonadota bacterium]